MNNLFQNKVLFIVTFVLVFVFSLGLTFWFLFFNESEPADNQSGSSSDTTPPASPSSSSRYLAYSSSAFDQQADKDRWLFFYLASCPKCVALDENIVANQLDIPAEVVIFKVDFSQQQDLRQRYGVTLQTTVLVTDAKGQERQRFVGTSSRHTLAELLSQFGYQ